MAYDKIIPIRRRLSRCVNYVLNEEKTGLASVLEYAENPAKTQNFITGINCTPETALSEMNATKRRWDKKGGVLGYGDIPALRPRLLRIRGLGILQCLRWRVHHRPRRRRAGAAHVL